MAWFGGRIVRVLKEATTDGAFAQFSSNADLPMVLVFLERFERLGILPPGDPEKRRILAAHDVIMHAVRDDLVFYEFCSKGARGERNPWISIFFHVDADAIVRICGVETTDVLARQRGLTLERMRMRVEILDRWLARQRRPRRNR